MVFFLCVAELGTKANEEKPKLFSNTECYDVKPYLRTHLKASLFVVYVCVCVFFLSFFLCVAELGTKANEEKP